MSEEALRSRIIETCLAMNRVGINHGKAGNCSARVADGFLVTPTGIPYDRLEPADIVLIDHDGAPHGRRLPSSEWRFHYDILAARPEIQAIVHTHAMFATTLACLGRGIPPFHYMIAVAGGKDVRCAPYATFGTQALSDYAVAALDGRLACLLANHGMITIGRDLDHALAVSVEIETLAAQYWRVLQIGPPILLDDAEMDRVIEKFKTYGKQPEA